MTSPKERVRANIYMQLLAEEKKRNKKLSVFSISVFVLGVFATSGYNTMMTKVKSPESRVNFALAENNIKEFEKDSFMLDAIYNTGVLHEKTVSLNPDQLFGLDTQI